MKKKIILIYCSSIPLGHPPFNIATQGYEFNTFFETKVYDLSKKPIWDLYLLKIELTLKRIMGYKVVFMTTSAYWNEITNYVPADFRVLDIIDIFSPTQLEENREFIGSFDVVFNNSPLLKTQLEEMNGNIIEIDPGWFLKRDYKAIFPKNKIPHSVVFAGGISHRIDYTLLQTVIKDNPSLQFFFIGEVYLQKYYVDKKDKPCMKIWNTILREPNVSYLGAFSSETLKEVLPIFSVGIIPYDQEDFFNTYSHPIKVSEYLIAGMPVVSTYLPLVRIYEKNYPVTSTKTKEEFSDAMNHYFKKPFLKNFSITKLISTYSIEKKVSIIAQYIQKHV